MPQFIVVRLVDFHAAAERRVAPGLAGHPLVIGGPRHGRGTVVALSSEARALGVREGMPLRDASALAPHAVFLPGRLDRALDLACELDEAIRQHAAHVAWSTIDEATIQLASGSADALVDALAAEVSSRFGMVTAVGIAGSQIAACVAARLVGVRGILHVLPGYERRFLADLDITWLDGISPVVLDRLRSRGINTFGDVASLPSSTLVDVIGRGGPVLARHAAGDDDRRVAPATVPRRLCRTMAWDRLQVDATPTAVALDAHVETLARRLLHFGCGARSLSLRVEFDDGQAEQRSVSMSMPTADVASFLVAARALASRLQLDARPWRCATVAVGGLSAVPKQLALFGSRAVPLRAAARRRTRAGVAALAALPYLQKRRA